MRAILFARATATSFGGLRRSRSRSQGEVDLLLPSRAPENGGRPDDQSAAQGFVARARDDAEPDLAGRRVIPRRQTKPSREPASGTEKTRIGRLHYQHRGADQSDAGDLRQTSATRVVAMPPHQLGIDDFELRFNQGVFRRLNGEQLTCESR